MLWGLNVCVCVCVRVYAHIHNGGRVVCIEETPISFESPKQHPEINHKTYCFLRTLFEAV